ncbi:hypothetical protein GCM10009780_63860 [Actinomadura alba]
MVDDDLAVRRQAHVELYDVDAEGEGMRERRQRVLRPQAARASMTMRFDPV